jgi:hypothetical protein
MFREIEEVGQVAFACAVALIGFLESLAGVLADRLEKPVAGRAALVLGDYERLIDQLGQQVDVCVSQVPVRVWPSAPRSMPG